jgi:signal transduction histidine kinase
MVGNKNTLDRRSLIKFTYGFLSLLFIFLIDLYIPLGVAIGALYVCSIVLVMKQRKRVIVSIAAMASVMVLLKFYIFIIPDTTWIVLANRGISLLVIWATTILAVRYRLLDEKEKREAAVVEQKNKELEQFIYIASHDLKEPLRTIENIIKLFEMDYLQKLDNTGKQYAAYIHSSVTRMHNVIKELLDYGRIGQTAELKDIDCNKLLKDIQQDIALSIEETKASFKIENLPMIRGMETEIRMLFQNLINNSIKFRRVGVLPVISITAVKFEDMWQFAIQDNGIGINEIYQDKIFLIFQRLHEAKE